MSLPRALGIPLGWFDSGPENAITDVAGVRVGHTTIRAEADDRHGALRTGVTAIWPHEAWPWDEGVYAGVSVANGHGELIGICQLEEWGVLRSPLMLTSSLSIGAVYDGVARWAAEQDPRQCGHGSFFMPVVTEVSDLVLSDNRAFPITLDHVVEALEGASDKPPAQGAVGAGTGTICYDLKAGIGTASRRFLAEPGVEWTIGALVLTNYGNRRNLTIGGVPVGGLIDLPIPPARHANSCIVVLATDAPLLPHQLRRVAARAVIGLTRSGAFVGHGSGEIAIAFSTAARVAGPRHTVDLGAVADGFNPNFNPLFEASVEAVHEAVLNSLFAAETTTGYRDTVVHALPVDSVLDVLNRRGALL
jgi:D-aminopeptidase